MITVENVNKLSSENWGGSSRDNIEDHLELLMSADSTKVIRIPDTIAHQGHGDLFYVLNRMNIHADNNIICMRINGYSSPDEYDREDKSLIVPSHDLMSKSK